MIPGARAQAAIELLDLIVAAARDAGPAADAIVARYFRDRRYAGAKDRRAVRELVYRAIRRAGERPANGRAALLGLAQDDPLVAALFDGGPHAPAPIAADEPAAVAGIAPDWLETRLRRTIGAEALPALLARAPLDLRANAARTTRAALLAEFPGAAPTPHAPHGLRVPEGAAVDGSAPLLAGLCEVQDEGSQLVALACGARPGMTVVDLCAGGGGKTLALGAEMRGAGRLIACDVDRARLSRLLPRAARAGLMTVETRLLDGGREAAALADLNGAADLVVIDAPCSGTGTWRRNPEARWRLTPARLETLVAVQARLIDLGARLVRPGGALAYITCSLLDAEGRDQADAFLARTPGWTADAIALPAGAVLGPGWRLHPFADGTDGFFVARLRRAC